MMKVAGALAAVALASASVYVLSNKDVRKQTGKKMLKAMDGAENMIAKKMN